MHYCLIFVTCLAAGLFELSTETVDILYTSTYTPYQPTVHEICKI